MDGRETFSDVYIYYGMIILIDRRLLNQLIVGLDFPLDFLRHP